MVISFCVNRAGGTTRSTTSFSRIPHCSSSPSSTRASWLPLLDLVEQIEEPRELLLHSNLSRAARHLLVFFKHPHERESMWSALRVRRLELVVSRVGRERITSTDARGLRRFAQR